MNIDDYFNRRRRVAQEGNVIRLPVVIGHNRNEDILPMITVPDLLSINQHRDLSNLQPSRSQPQPSQQSQQSHRPQQRQVQPQNQDDEIINLVSDSDSSQDVQPRYTNNSRSDIIIDITELLVC